jgi:hypothetical protein
MLRIQDESTKRRVKPENQKTFVIIFLSDGWKAGKERSLFIISGISVAMQQRGRGRQIVQKCGVLQVGPRG